MYINLFIIWQMGRQPQLLQNHPVFRREIFGILLNVLDTSQTLSLLDTVNEAIFLAVIGR